MIKVTRYTRFLVLVWDILRYCHLHRLAGKVWVIHHKAIGYCPERGRGGLCQLSAGHAGRHMIFGGFPGVFVGPLYVWGEPTTQQESPTGSIDALYRTDCGGLSRG